MAELKRIKKITHGFVIQNYEGDVVVSQEFVAGDQVEYEDENHDSCDMPNNEQYFGFDMKQPPGGLR